MPKTNPWLALSSGAPFVLDEDRSILDAFNRKANDRTRVETALLPEPHVGRTDAPVILLLLNPGVSDDDFLLHGQAEFRDRVRRCHRQEPGPYPNYYLDSAVIGPGARWMTRVTRPLLAEFGAQTVAIGVTVLEYFPYHSRNFAHHRLRVLSQDFTFDLLRSAIRRDAAIFITRGRSRGRNIWESAVPELRGYTHAYRTNSVLNVVISPKNCPHGYQAARITLRQLATT